MAGLNALKDAHVVKTELRLPELRFRFDNGATLVVFPDEPDYAADPLWDLATPQASWRVFNSGAIERE